MEMKESRVAKNLCDSFISKWNSTKHIKELKDKFSIKSSENSIFMTLFWLYYLAFTRAALSSPGKISTEQFQSIADQLTTNAIEKYKYIFGIRKDGTEILSLYGGIGHGLFACYDQNKDSQPSVHWHVGKEMCSILNGNDVNADPEMIIYFSELLHEYTVTIKKYIDSL